MALLLPQACSSVPARSDTAQTNPIQNLHLLSTGLYSGDEPATADHYRQLANLGIKTVISVDAVAPNPDLAAAHNIRIVHLPIGYEGIDDSRVIELAAAIHQLDRPIYLHCHHGKHRGPAALSVGAIGAGIITNDQAAAFMTLAGTSGNYPGLWKAAKDAGPLNPATLQSVTEFPARAPVSGFVDGMGKLDRLYDQLWDIAENDWQPDDYHPDMTATAASGLISDHLRAMLELDFFKRRGTMMRSRFETLTSTAGLIESHIEAKNYTQAFDSLNTLSNSCIDCHDRFRN